MKIKDIFIGFLLLAIVGGGGYFAYRRLVLPKQNCSVCGRNLYPGHESTIMLKDGRKLLACCPRCALHHEQNNPRQVEGVLVSDHNSGEKIKAQEAVYVEGSDEPGCIPETSASPREPGIEYRREYDRCIPSLLAFKEEEGARRFLAAHGGRLLSYGQVLESITKR